ncbi:MAG TPA: hypothetical protein VMC79_16675 [Rectinemataceae bacterium]|nr:hypothetical protein [Rectinemataceae bacterium]
MPRRSLLRWIRLTLVFSRSFVACAVWAMSEYFFLDLYNPSMEEDLTRVRDGITLLAKVIHGAATTNEEPS